MQVAELGSLTTAAERLRIAQPALSRQIRLLEDEFGTPLFERHGRGMELTQTGQRLYRRIGPMLRELEEIRADVAEHSKDVRGRIVIGMPPSCTEAFGSTLVRRYMERYPEVSVSVIAGLSGHLFDWLQRQEIDGAFLYSPPNTENFTITALATESLCLIGRDAALAATDAVDFRVAVGLPLVLPGRKHGLRLILESAAHAIGHKLNVVVEADSLRLQLDLVDESSLFTVAARMAVRRLSGREVVAIWKLTNPDLTRELVFATPSATPFSPALRAFLQEAQALITTEYLAGIGDSSIATVDS